jgi:hypothetical protein
MAMSMRKLLLGTTALVGAGVLSVAAPSAAGAAEVLPGGALDVTISGFIRFRAHSGDLDAQRGNPDQGQGLDFSNDTEAHVIVRGKHDATGIEYGGTIEFEAETDRETNTDETWVFVRGGFGELRFGDEDGATDASSVGAYTIAAGTGGIDGSVIDVVDITAIRPFNSDDSTKIRYYTPSFGGFQVGVSYTPNVDSNGGDLVPDTDAIDVGDMVEAAAVYEGAFGGFGIQASLTGFYGDVKNESNLGGDDAQGYYAGLATEVFGFKVAGGWGHDEVGDGERDYYNVGLGYGIGPVNVSVNYGDVYDNEDNFLGSSSESQNLVFSADTALMPGLVLAGDFALFDNNRDDDIEGVDDDGYVWVVRLGLAF